MATLGGDDGSLSCGYTQVAYDLSHFRFGL